MFFFTVSFFSFIMFISKSLSLKPLPSWANELRLLSFEFCKESLSIFLQWLTNSKCTSYLIRRIPSRMFSRKKAITGPVEMDETEKLTILDLPELALEHILTYLPPVGLCNMAGVCRAMRDICSSDHLWETHMRQKWGRLIGPVACKQWQCYIASESSYGSTNEKPGWSIGSLLSVWPISWLRSMTVGCRKLRNSLPVDPVMSWYLSLEGGRFWFPGQVYNRENGHYGFMLSCYDAEISYDRRTDTFLARYPPHGRRLLVVEDGIQWNRVRPPPVETSPHNLHISENLTDLCPRDHIEIQWRRNKEFPYGWWYGVVGHLETCDGSNLNCFCHRSDTVVLEFSQYSVDSPWRRTSISRTDHHEEGSEAGGFYGGVRRLQSKEEISMWRRLWPIELLD